MSITIARVPSLPATLAPDTIYLVSAAGSTKASIVITGLNGSTAKTISSVSSVADISDISSIIRPFLGSASLEGARAAIGAGTSNLALGSTAVTAKPGNWIPSSTEISSSFGALSHGLVYASPASGTGGPSMRALVASDIPQLNQNTTGNAATATALSTARSINGTSFDGTGNITTRTWGTSRIISIAGVPKQINGSEDVEWTTEEISQAMGASGITEANILAAFGEKQPTWVMAAPALGPGPVSFRPLMASDIPQLNQNTTGRAATATLADALTESRNINGTAFDGSSDITTAKWGSERTITVGNASKLVDGSSDVSFPLSEIGAASSGHSHTSLDVANALGYTAARETHTHSSSQISDSTAVGRSVLTAASQAAARTAIGAGTSSLILGTTSVTAKRGDYTPSSAEIEASLGYIPAPLNANGQVPAENLPSYVDDVVEAANLAAFPGTGEAGKVYVALDTNRVYRWTGSIYLWINSSVASADTADTLSTARTINGTNFNGAANITTALWGTARNIAIGSSTKSVNGSGNVSWTLVEIGAAPESHTHTSGQISDSSAVGRSLLTAADAAAARTAIGAGTSSLTLGTTASTAKAGNYVPAWTEVTGKPSTFTPATHTHTASQISDSTATGRSVLTAADATAARAAIGAGTGNSNLTIGTTATTAKAGNWVPTWNDVTGKPLSFTPTSHTHPTTEIGVSAPVRNFMDKSTTGQMRGALGIYIQSTEPAGMVAGDIWFQT